MIRAFLYGDLIFETIHVIEGKIPFMWRHYKRLTHSAQVLKFDLCGLNEEKFSEILQNEISLFQQNNAETANLRLRFVLYRNGGGFYLPLNHQTQYEVEVTPFHPAQSNQALKGGIYPHQQKAPGILSNIKSGNALVYVMAKIWAQENQLDEALITNCDNEIIEASSSNLFWQKDLKWYTPPLSSGCIAGIGREIFMEQNEVEEKKCYQNDLLTADKIILTNALNLERTFLLVENQLKH